MRFSIKHEKMLQLKSDFLTTISIKLFCTIFLKRCFFFLHLHLNCILKLSYEMLIMMHIQGVIIKRTKTRFILRKNGVINVDTFKDSICFSKIIWPRNNTIKYENLRTSFFLYHTKILRIWNFQKR